MKPEEQPQSGESRRNETIGRIVALLSRFSDDFLDAIAQRLEEQCPEDPVRQRPNGKAAGYQSATAKRQAPAAQVGCGVTIWQFRR